MDETTVVRSSKQLSLLSSCGVVLMWRSNVVTLGSVVISGQIFKKTSSNNHKTTVGFVFFGAQ